MIRLSKVTKYYATSCGGRNVLDQVDLSIEPGQVLGVLGQNGAGKSTLIRIIGGVESPSEGFVTRAMSVSWPLAFGGAFQGSLTGDDNLRFVCRVYGVDYGRAKDYVQAFAELGEYFREPVKTYSTGMRSRLAFAISMAIRFDCYLVDEIIAVGDARFHARCHQELFERNPDSAKVIVSHNAAYLRSICTRFAVLQGGRLRLAADFEEAEAIHDQGGKELA